MCIKGLNSLGRSRRFSLLLSRSSSKEFLDDDSHLNFLERNNEAFQEGKVELQASIIILYEILLQDMNTGLPDEEEIERRYNYRNRNSVQFKPLYQNFYKFRLIHKTNKGYSIDPNTQFIMSDFIKDGFPYPKPVLAIIKAML